MIRDGDGFDHYGGSIANMLNGIIAASDDFTVVTTNPRTGTHSLLQQASGNDAIFHRRVIPGLASPVIGVGWGIYPVTLPSASNNRYVSFRDTNNAAIATFFWNTDGRVRAYRGTTTALLGTSLLPTITAETYKYCEFKLARSATVGSMAMRVNEELVVWDTVDGLIENVNTAGTANDITQIQIGGDGCLMYWDDYLCWDALGDYNNDWVGDQQLNLRMPTADHAMNAAGGWVGNVAGTLYDKIDETTPSAADYMRALLSGAEAAFEYSDIPADITNVIAAIPYVFAKKLNAGPSSLQLGMMKDGFVNFGGSTITMSTVDTYYRSIVETNPATDLPFTPAEINDAYLHVLRAA
jgi:hypothetical protein